MNTGLKVLLLAAGIALAACSPAPKSVAKVQPAAVDAVAVTRSASGSARSWDGVIEAVNRATLSAQTSGRIAAVEADVNDTVTVGQVLLRLSDVEQQAGNAAARAQVKAQEAALVEAEANYQRFATLAEKNWVSRAQMDQAVNTRNSARAMRDAARAQLRQLSQQTDYTIIRAPYDGVVERRMVELGESVTPGQPLISVLAPGALRVEIQVPQEEAAAIREVGRAQLRSADGTVHDVARVIVYPSADPQTHATTVRLELDASSGLHPGNAVKAEFPIGSGGHLLIPAGSVLQRSEVSAVYVVTDAGIQLRQIRLGQTHGDQREVIAGLHAGERVAVDPIEAMQALVSAREQARQHE
ncbi:MAG: efflux RND transporter periplasmic adaptor subunit [Dokdonella sp.]